jgi:hypothetical protein
MVVFKCKPRYCEGNHKITGVTQLENATITKVLELYFIQ